MLKIEFYTDGSSKNNGSKNNEGGYGIAILKQNDKYSSGYEILNTFKNKESNTTNNRMEMKAILSALELSQKEYIDYYCIIKSDSAYCVNMFNDWIYTWAKNDWINSRKVTVENLDLVKQLYEYAKMEFPNFRIEKVRGHNGLMGNELADALATNNMDKITKIYKENEQDILFRNLF